MRTLGLRLARRQALYSRLLTTARFGEGNECLYFREGEPLQSPRRLVSARSPRDLSVEFPPKLSDRFKLIRIAPEISEWYDEDPDQDPDESNAAKLVIKKAGWRRRTLQRSEDARRGLLAKGRGLMNWVDCIPRSGKCRRLKSSGSGSTLKERVILKDRASESKSVGLMRSCEDCYTRPSEDNDSHRDKRSSEEDSESEWDPAEIMKALEKGCGVRRVKSEVVAKLLETDGVLLECGRKLLKALLIWWVDHDDSMKLNFFQMRKDGVTPFVGVAQRQTFEKLFVDSETVRETETAREMELERRRGVIEKMSDESLIQMSVGVVYLNLYQLVVLREIIPKSGRSGIRTLAAKLDQIIKENIVKLVLRKNDAEQNGHFPRQRLRQQIPPFPWETDFGNISFDNPLLKQAVGIPDECKLHSDSSVYLASASFTALNGIDTSAGMIQNGSPVHAGHLKVGGIKARNSLLLYRHAASTNSGWDTPKGMDFSPTPSMDRSFHPRAGMDPRVLGIQASPPRSHFLQSSPQSRQRSFGRDGSSARTPSSSPRMSVQSRTSDFGFGDSSAVEVGLKKAISRSLSRREKRRETFSLPGGVLDSFSRKDRQTMGEQILLILGAIGIYANQEATTASRLTCGQSTTSRPSFLSTAPGDATSTSLRGLVKGRSNNFAFRSSGTVVGRSPSTTESDHEDDETQWLPDMNCLSMKSRPSSHWMIPCKFAENNSKNGPKFLKLKFPDLSARVIKKKDKLPVFPGVYIYTLRDVVGKTCQTYNLCRLELTRDLDLSAFDTVAPLAQKPTLSEILSSPLLHKIRAKNKQTEGDGVEDRKGLDEASDSQRLGADKRNRRNMTSRRSGDETLGTRTSGTGSAPFRSNVAGGRTSSRSKAFSPRSQRKHIRWQE